MANGWAWHDLMLLKCMQPIQVYRIHKKRAKEGRLKSQGEAWLTMTMTTRSEQEQQLTRPIATTNIQHKNITYPA